jgi:hypothetical protein
LIAHTVSSSDFTPCRAVAAIRFSCEFGGWSWLS